MILHRCQTCNEERFDNYFNRAISAEGDIYAKTKRCKICLGQKILNVDEEKYEVDFNKMMLVLTRLHFNKGFATNSDCILIMESYKNLYGERMPSFPKNRDRLIYQWERLKGFWNRNKEFQF